MTSYWTILWLYLSNVDFSFSFRVLSFFLTVFYFFISNSFIFQNSLLSLPGACHLTNFQKYWLFNLFLPKNTFNHCFFSQLSEVVSFILVFPDSEIIVEIIFCNLFLWCNLYSNCWFHKGNYFRHNYSQVIFLSVNCNFNKPDLKIENKFYCVRAGMSGGEINACFF